MEAGGSDLNGDGLVDAWTDSDGDGVVDAVDVDITGGDDADGDGIDDFADADFVFLSDTDGDGIVDLFDSDFLGDGFLPFTADGDSIANVELPDVDGNGIIDVLEPNAALPEVAAAEGVILTGLAGRGCAIAPLGTLASNGVKAPVDPTLPLLALLAAGALTYRRRTRATLV